MNPEIKPGNLFPNLALPDWHGKVVELASLTAPGQYNQMLGFTEGYPLIVVFYRGYFCPRDNKQLRDLVQFQQELAVNYARLVAISADPPDVCAAYRAGLGASFPFLSDHQRTAIDQLGIRDQTESEYPGVAIPTTFILAPDLTIHKVYNGWFFVGRPTLEELRHDLRALMTHRADYEYAAWNQPQVKALRVPAEHWQAGAPALGAGGNPIGRGIVQWFNLREGYGAILAEDGQEIFLHFSGIPGLGYRTVRPGESVAFEIAHGPTGRPHAVNVQLTHSD